MAKHPTQEQSLKNFGKFNKAFSRKAFFDDLHREPVEVTKKRLAEILNEYYDLFIETDRPA